LASELCQTIADELFLSFDISFYKLSKHKICQLKFSKLFGDSNSNSLVGQLGIHLVLAKTRKVGLQQFGKPTWQK
jgi:hypothetical protein